MSKKEESPWVVGAKCTIFYSGGAWNRDKWVVLTIVRETKKQVVTSDGSRWWNEERQMMFGDEVVLRMVGHRNELRLFKPEHALSEKRAKAWEELRHWWFELSKTDIEPPKDLSNKELSSVYKATRALRRKLIKDN